MTMTIDQRRRRLLWRAEHRGMRELDLVLGGFARAHVFAMDAAALGELEAIVAMPDADLADWLTRRLPVPPEHRSSTFAALLAFRP
jgi:antitoxin CptB